MAGVITLRFPPGVSPRHAVYVEVILLPAAAVTDGAAWRIDGIDPVGTYPRDCHDVGVWTSPVHGVIEVKPLPGWNTPPSQTINVRVGVQLDSFVYTVQKQVRALEVCTVVERPHVRARQRRREG